MTTIMPMARAKPDGIADVMAKAHAGKQSRMGDERRPLRPLSIERPERSVGTVKDQQSSAVAAQLTPHHDAKVYQAIDAVAAVMLRAQTGLNWLGAEQPDLEEVRKALNGIAADAGRLAEIVLRLRGA
jgi:hypothetical protein